MKPLCMEAAVPPRLEMTGFGEVEVQGQIENYAYTFNFTPRQKQTKGCVLETQPVSGFLKCCRPMHDAVSFFPV